MSSLQDDLSKYMTICRYREKSIQNEEKTETSQPSEDELDSTTKTFPVQEKQKRSASDVLLEINPRWEEMKRLYHFRMKTLLKIYYSKWFYQGLDWFEIEFLYILMEKLNYNQNWAERVVIPARNKIVGKRIAQTRRISQSSMEEIPIFEQISESVLAINLRGCDILRELSLRFDSLDNPTSAMDRMKLDLELLYSEEDFKSVWKLRSFQSLRDKLFLPFHARSLGKKGIKRNRIRGYRDGKGSAGDPTRTRLAREVDALFWSEKYFSKLDNFFDDLEKLSCT